MYSGVGGGTAKPKPTSTSSKNVSLGGLGLGLRLALASVGTSAFGNEALRGQKAQIRVVSSTSVARIRLASPGRVQTSRSGRVHVFSGQSRLSHFRASAAEFPGANSIAFSVSSPGAASSKQVLAWKSSSLVLPEMSVSVARSAGNFSIG